MKENVIDILMYLLQSAPMTQDAERHDHEALTTLLMDAGFGDTEIDEAFRWLDDLDAQISQQPPITQATHSIRCFSAIEESILDTNCRNYLLGLVNTGILIPNSFELVIDRILALASDEIGLGHLEWIVLIVLSNQTDQQEAFQRLEAMRFHDLNSRLN